MPPSKLIEFGRYALALGLAGLGTLTLDYRDFALGWQPIPAGLPLYAAMACVSGAILVAVAAGLLFAPSRIRAAQLLAVYLAVAWVLPQIFRLMHQITNLGLWLGVCETLAALCGGWILSIALLERKVREGPMIFTSAASLHAARVAFGVCCCVFGASHIVYADFTATMIPHWLPLPQTLAYLTGVAHVAAGLAIVFAIVPRIAAIGEALMMSCFVVLVHLPSLLAAPALAWAPDFRTQATALFWALVLAASAWIVAGSFDRAKS